MLSAIWSVWRSELFVQTSDGCVLWVRVGQNLILRGDTG